MSDLDSLDINQFFANSVGAAQGVIKVAEVVDVKQNDVIVNYNTVDFRIGTSSASYINTTDLYFVYSDNNGVFIGANPPKGNPVIAVKESGDKYHGIKYYSKADILPKKLEEGQLLLKNNDTNILNFIKNNIILGNFENRGLVLNTALFSSNNNFDHQFSFSQASRSVNGMIKREIQDSGYHDILKLIEDDIFTSKKTQAISFVTTADNSNGSVTQKINKNPNFVENRKLVYEFEYSSDIVDLQTELKLISNQNTTAPNNNRHRSRLDVLGLSLNDPNYLIETIEGNVVDIYGNLLDLNRYPIKTKLDQNDSADKTFLKLKEDQRRSMAFHFEINARKDLGTSGVAPDVQQNKDYARNRSRFFIDIDKEGQFKINVPASSEAGNIPLLTRYENYNTVRAAKNSEFHPNEAYFPNITDQKIDILHDSFVAGIGVENKDFESIKNNLKYNHGLIAIKKNGAEISPLDRLNSEPAHVKHGTVYHDIFATCFAHQRKDFVDYIKFGGDSELEAWWQDTFIKIPLTESIVSKEIEIGKNAGGRSGSINLDGSLELNVGANTVDRQSIWLDTAGGMIANFGKDKNNISAAMSMDGQLLVQIGTSKSITKNQDSRFEDTNNAPSDGALDIRVYFQEHKQAAVFRVDKNGIILVSPSGIHLQSNQNITIQSAADVKIEGENVFINERVFEKPIYSDTNTI